MKWDKEEIYSATEEQVQEQLQQNQQNISPPTTHICSLKGYIQWGHYPVLGGSNACHHCFCFPHIMQNTPSFYSLLLCCSAHLAKKCRLHHLRKLSCGLLTMAKLTGSLMGLRGIGKVRNQKVTKSRIVLLLVLFVKNLCTCITQS